MSPNWNSHTVRVAAVLGLALLGLLTAATGVWGALALAYSGPQSEALRYFLAGAFAVASLAVLIGLWLRRWRWRASRAATRAS